MPEYRELLLTVYGDYIDRVAGSQVDLPLVRECGGEPVIPAMETCESDPGWLFVWGLSIHSARHTVAVHLLRKTNNLRMVQKQLGRASPATTVNLYADMRFENMQEGLTGLYAEEDGQRTKG